MVVQVNDFTDFASYQFMERTGVKQGLSDIGFSRCLMSYPHVIQVVEVALKVFLGNVV